MTLIDNTLPNNFIQLRQLDKYLVGHRGFIAGGVFKNIFNNEKFKDVDIFFESEKDWHEAFNYFKSQKDDYTESYKNDKVVAFRNIHTNVTVELIKFTYKKPKDLLKEFDFTITKFAYYKEEVGEENEMKGVEWKVLYHNQFFEHLHLKRLVIDQEFDKIDKPVNTLNRSYRYAKYGYFPCRETKVKMIQALRGLLQFRDDMLSNELYNGFD